MQSIIFSGLGISGALLLVALNGVFVAAEFAFVKIRSAQVEEGRASARIVKGATRKLDRYVHSPRPQRRRQCSHYYGRERTPDLR